MHRPLCSAGFLTAEEHAAPSPFSAARLAQWRSCLFKCSSAIRFEVAGGIDGSWFRKGPRIVCSKKLWHVLGLLVLFSTLTFHVRIKCSPWRSAHHPAHKHLIIFRTTNEPRQHKHTLTHMPVHAHTRTHAHTYLPVFDSLRMQRMRAFFNLSAQQVWVH
jgi:hypothetical protein